MLENAEDVYFKSPELLQFLDKHGITVSGVPNSVRGGRNVVYLFDDKVLKLTRDQNEATLASHLRGDPITAVIDVEKIGDIYGILQDRVEFDKNHPVAKGLDVMMAYLMNNGDEALDKPPKQIEKEALAELAHFGIKGADVATAAMMLQRVKAKTGVTLNDAVPDNVGIRDGKPVLTDLGQEY